MVEIDSMIQKIYEDYATSKLSDERYATLSISYEEGQQRLKADILEIEKAFQEHLAQRERSKSKNGTAKATLLQHNNFLI